MTLSFCRSVIVDELLCWESSCVHAVNASTAVNAVSFMSLPLAIASSTSGWSVGQLSAEFAALPRLFAQELGRKALAFGDTLNFNRDRIDCLLESGKSGVREGRSSRIHHARLTSPRKKHRGDAAHNHGDGDKEHDGDDDFSWIAHRNSWWAFIAIRVAVVFCYAGIPLGPSAGSGADVDGTGAPPLGLNRIANKTKTISAPAEGTSQIECQSCVTVRH